MLNSQRHQLRISEIRTKLNEHAGADDVLTDDQIAEVDVLKREYRSCETKLQAALVSEADEATDAEAQFTTGETAEARELRGLIERADIGQIVAAAIGGRATVGVEAELQQHYVAGNPHAIPTALLTTPATEQRAAATAVAPATTAGPQQPIIPAIFPTRLAEFMGVQRASVPPGSPIYPVVATPNSGPASSAKAAEVADSAATFATYQLAPKRVQRSFTLNREDIAAFPGFGDAVRMNLADSLADGLDYFALRETGEGLFDFGTDPTASGTTMTWALFLDAVYGQVDGRYADNIAGIKLLIGADTYALMSKTYRAAGTEQTALKELASVSGGVRLSAHAPAQSSGNVQEAVVARSLEAIHSVQPVWPGITLEDPFSLSKDGQIRLTAVALTNFKVVRAAGYSRLAWDLA